MTLTKETSNEGLENKDAVLSSVVYACILS